MGNNRGLRNFTLGKRLDGGFYKSIRKDYVPGPTFFPPIRAHTEHYGFLNSFGSSAFLISAGLASSFLGVAAGPLALRISWMYCSRIRAR
jgi:hypothetical protein